MCVLIAPPTGSSPVSLPLLRPPYSLGHNIEIRPINNPTNASKYSSESKSHTFLTLNPKLVLIKLGEEGMSKAEIAASARSTAWKSEAYMALCSGAPRPPGACEEEEKLSSVLYSVSCVEGS